MCRYISQNRITSTIFETISLICLDQLVNIVYLRHLKVFLFSFYFLDISTKYLWLPFSLNATPGNSAIMLCFSYIVLPYEAAIAHCCECFMSALTYLRACSRAFVRACLRACVRACVRAFVRACRCISQNRITSAIFRPFN